MYNEAIRGPDKAAWQNAIQEESDQLNGNNTWVLEPLRDKAKPVQNKWVYVTKKDAQQRVTGPRARLVAEGFTQKLGVDEIDTFAPVAKYLKLRFLLALASNEELQLPQLDVKAAFFNGNLDEVIYMTHPEGFVDKQRPNFVYRLLKALYGLKQAS